MTFLLTLFLFLSTLFAAFPQMCVKCGSFVLFRLPAIVFAAAGRFFGFLADLVLKQALLARSFGYAGLLLSLVFIFSNTAFSAQSLETDGALLLYPRENLALPVAHLHGSLNETLNVGVDTLNVSATLGSALAEEHGLCTLGHDPNLQSLQSALC